MTVGDVMQWIRECIAERRLLQLLVLPKGVRIVVVAEAGDDHRVGGDT
jgi:hypothetical protein